jgi:hypothetical protein
MQWRTRGMRMLGASAATAAVFTAVAVPAGASHADTTPTIEVQGGETQPIFSRADAVYQTVDVQTTIDSDNDGERDTVRVRILRPKETERGLKVPVIMEPSPYWANTLDIPNHGVDVDGDGLDDTTGKRYSAPPDSDRRSGSKITSELLGGAPRGAGRRPGLVRLLRQLLPAPWLRRGPGGQHRQRWFDRLPDHRRSQRDARSQGGRGLADRRRQGLGRKR